MMSSVASFAKMTPPITGASTTSMPRGFSASASERVAAGLQVLMSITIAPLASPAATQFSEPSPSTTLRTTLSSGSMVITASAPCAASTSDGRRLAAVLRDERLHRLGPDVVDRDVEALLHQMPGHGVAHVSDPDEADFLNYTH